jgi:hypothetical protein
VQLKQKIVQFKIQNSFPFSRYSYEHTTVYVICKLDITKTVSNHAFKMSRKVQKHYIFEVASFNYNLNRLQEKIKLDCLKSNFEIVL